ncbi:MAG: glycosyltransferase family 39 protein [Anaerolineae bacterium]|jgi:hypothetical protein|nr:glycosyltransferase family 39 protein [Anaerolineae bacterium]
MKPRLAALLPVVLLLLGLFALRSQHIDVQPPYVDEGFHLRRAMRVWDFAENPGRFAHGKVLVYFWMGLFEADNTPRTMLPVGRLSIALVAVITGAALYLLGRLLAGPLTGIVALALYALLPPALFFERMAMADPLAAGLLSLAAWRCYVYVKRPTLWQGALVGLLLGLTTLAKLTTALIVLLPVVALLLFAPRPAGGPLRLIQHWRRRYLPGLLVGALLGGGLWLPMLIPAALAHGTDQPFIIVNDTNIARSEEYFFQPLNYVQHLTPLLAEFVTPGFLAATVLAFAVGLVTFRGLEARVWRGLLYSSAWLLLLTLPAFFIARLITTRYVMPAAAPVSLGLALVVVALLRLVRRSWLFALPGLALLAWALLWALPFAATTLHAPQTLPFARPDFPAFYGTNHTEYIAGYFLGDDAVQAAARTLNALPPRPVYATWNLCHLIFFYVEQPITCLPERSPRRTLQNTLAPLPAGTVIYAVMADYEPFWDNIDHATWSLLAEYPRRLIKRPVFVVELVRR